MIRHPIVSLSEFRARQQNESARQTDQICKLYQQPHVGHLLRQKVTPPWFIMDTYQIEHYRPELVLCPSRCPRCGHPPYLSLSFSAAVCA